MAESDAQPHTPRHGWLKNGNRTGDFNTAPRCGAKTRKGTTCQCPAMKNGRCRMHGGASMGPRTEEGKERVKRSHLKHGLRSREYTEKRKAAISVRSNINLILKYLKPEC